MSPSPGREPGQHVLQRYWSEMTLGALGMFTEQLYPAQDQQRKRTSPACARARVYVRVSDTRMLPGEVSITQ